MSYTRRSKMFNLTGAFSRRILLVLALVLSTAMVGLALGVWSLQRVSNETARMVDDAMATERLAADLHRHLSVNVARSKAFALSSEPQVGEVLSPEINQTSVVVEEFLHQLGTRLTGREDQEMLHRMLAANREFLQARQELNRARDGGVTATIERAYVSRFTPTAQTLLATVTGLRDFQQARIDAAVIQISDLSRSARWGLTLFGLGALLLGGLLSIWLVRSITRPIQQAVDAANQVSALNLTEHIEGHDRDEGGRLLAALGRMQTSLQALVAEVQGASHSVAEGATQIAAGNHDFSSRTEMAASFLQQTVVAVEEISAAMHQSLQQASHGEALARSAATQAGTGSTVMTEVMLTMDDINKSSRQIAEITALIDGIAFQTNILALNAAVEAARAGAHGRGFAVVATEVRALANRSAAAAREIKSLISASVEQVKLGTGKVHRARDTMSTIVEAVAHVVQVIGDISSGTRQQSGRMSSINTALSQLDQMTQQNAAVVEESAAAAQSLQEQADDLRNVAGQFRLPGLALALR